MRIGIVGAGVMGAALARRFRHAGHEVVMGSRRSLLSENGFRFGPYAEAVRFGQVIVLATLWDGTQTAIAQCGPLRNRILIDATNPEDDVGKSLPIPGGLSGAEQIARWAEGARVVKAFNHIYAEVLDSGPALDGQTASAFYCGDDRSAKVAAAELIAGAGLEAVDAGSLSSARMLEALAALMVELVRRQGHPPSDIALKLLRRVS
jgi:8-hydroxy-5-deazaflavin:NADPH oxidoreductase